MIDTQPVVICDHENRQHWGPFQNHQAAAAFAAQADFDVDSMGEPLGWRIEEIMLVEPFLTTSPS